MRPTSSGDGRSATPLDAAETPLQRLLNGVMRPGTVHWMGLRPSRHAPMQVVEAATFEVLTGLVGDHYGGRGGARQVSLIGVENLHAIGAFLGSGAAAAELLRRNIVVGGVNLLALKGHTFRLGESVLAFSGECHPCSRMETLLGPGGYNAVRGQGGVLARVVRGGVVRVGDKLWRLDEPAAACMETA